MPASRPGTTARGIDGFGAATATPWPPNGCRPGSSRTAPGFFRRIIHMIAVPTRRWHHSLQTERNPTCFTACTRQQCASRAAHVHTYCNTSAMPTRNAQRLYPDPSTTRSSRSPWLIMPSMARQSDQRPRGNPNEGITGPATRIAGGADAHGRAQLGAVIVGLADRHGHGRDVAAHRQAQLAGPRGLPFVGIERATIASPADKGERARGSALCAVPDADRR